MCEEEAVFKQPSCNPAAFKRADLIAASCLVELNWAVGTRLIELARSDAHGNTHIRTHTNVFPFLISINHWTFCKCCWLPIINDYALLAAGEVMGRGRPFPLDIMQQWLYADGNKIPGHIFMIMSIQLEISLNCTCIHWQHGHISVIWQMRNTC